MEELDTITITFEDGEETDFYVLEQTTLMGVNYYLVTPADADEDDEELECFILKENANESDEEYGEYSFVEDEKELDSLSKIFDELMEDSDMGVEF
ncbi:MAG: DUF1292 domain-containing protein [Lachnospiraceae bacterium]|jgi:uncharacterized protein YrzB (UPF0473 family)|nr:DUF1292 domain-containing protein [Lachnospiraceae bacterium]